MEEEAQGRTDRASEEGAKTCDELSWALRDAISALAAFTCSSSRAALEACVQALHVSMASATSQDKRCEGTTARADEPQDTEGDARPFKLK
jgi:hypothetical protein